MSFTYCLQRSRIKIPSLVGGGDWASQEELYCAEGGVDGQQCDPLAPAQIPVEQGRDGEDAHDQEHHRDV